MREKILEGKVLMFQFVFSVSKRYCRMKNWKKWKTILQLDLKDENLETAENGKLLTFIENKTFGCSIYWIQIHLKHVSSIRNYVFLKQKTLNS